MEDSNNFNGKQEENLVLPSVLENIDTDKYVVGLNHIIDPDPYSSSEYTNINPYLNVQYSGVDFIDNIIEDSFSILDELDSKVQRQKQLGPLLPVELHIDEVKEIIKTIESLTTELRQTSQDLLRELNTEKNDDILISVNQFIKDYLDEDETSGDIPQDLIAVQEKLEHIKQSQINEVQRIRDSIKVYQKFGSNGDITPVIEENTKLSKIDAYTEIIDAVASKNFNPKDIGILNRDEPAKTCIPKFARYMTKMLDTVYNELTNKLYPTNTEEQENE